MENFSFQVQGIALVNQVIAQAQREPATINAFIGHQNFARPLGDALPLPVERLEDLTLPSGRKLPSGLLSCERISPSFASEAILAGLI